MFYLVSVVWGLDIIIKSGYATDPTQLWVGYPHDLMRYAPSEAAGISGQCGLTSGLVSLWLGMGVVKKPVLACGLGKSSSSCDLLAFLPTTDRLSLKFFMLNQMAFWLHCYPELVFMKTRKVRFLFPSSPFTFLPSLHTTPNTPQRGTPT